MSLSLGWLLLHLALLPLCALAGWLFCRLMMRDRRNHCLSSRPALSPPSSASSQPPKGQIKTTEDDYYEWKGLGHAKH